jgi:excisionase family DNA binding protein
MATQEPALLTVPEVMAALRLGRSSVYELIRRRELASLTIGRTRRIPRAALTIYLNHRAEEETWPAP